MSTGVYKQKRKIGINHPNLEFEENFKPLEKLIDEETNLVDYVTFQYLRSNLFVYKFNIFDIDMLNKLKNKYLYKN